MDKPTHEADRHPRGPGHPGIRLADVPVSRRAGAGPSDDGNLLLDGLSE